MTTSSSSADRRAAPVAGAPLCELGESPVWDSATGRLWWVDLPAGLVHCLDPITARSGTVDVGQPVSSLARHADGWLVGVETGIQYRDVHFRQQSQVSLLPRPTVVRMNDGELDPRGRFLLGTLAYDGRPGAGCLFRIDRDGTHKVMLTGLGISNGICFSIDGRVMFHVDSSTRAIRAHAYDLESGELGESEIFYQHPDDGAVPDGIALDAQGGLWVALWDGGRVIRLDSTGRCTDVVPVDAARPSSVAFGGAGCDVLYVTSARRDPGSAARSGDGALHAFRPWIAGHRLGQKSVLAAPITRSALSTRNRAR